MAWRWVPEREPEESVPPRTFASQGEAETWLGEFYPELLAAGVLAVNLYEEDRLVYGPMNLAPDHTEQCVATPRYILDLRRSYGQGRLLLVGVSGVVVRDDLEPPRSHILLVRRSDTGRWSLPAGIVEPDEQPAATIVRELFEETRVRGRPDRLALLTTDPELVYPNGDRCQYISITFRCSYLGGDAQVGDEECTEVAWFPTDELPGELPALLRRRIATALADQDACVFDT